MKLNCFRKTLSAILCAVLIVATVFSTGAFSFAEELESGSCGENVLYSFDAQSGTLTISGEGDMYSYAKASNSPFYNNQEIKSLIVTDGVSSIGDNSFYFDNNLAEVSLSKDILSIGKNAFYSCSFESIDLPSGLQTISLGAFNLCKNLKSISIPSGVSVISKSSFAYCNALEDVSFNGNITSVEDKAFYFCEALKSIIFPSSVSSIASEAFYFCTNLESITFPSNLKTIGSAAFGYCSSLEEIVLPEGLETIEKNAFSHCSKLSSLNYPTSLVSIGDYAFSATGFTEIDYPGRLKLSTGLFSSCSKLEKVTLGEGITTVENEAFSNCNKLTDVNLPQSLISIGRYGFSNCTALSEISLPSDLKYIQTGAFVSCTRLERISIPDNVLSLDTKSFYGCTSLQSIELPANLKSIYSLAFFGCKELQSVTLPSQLQGIYTQAFCGCEKLQSIIVPETVQILGSQAFASCTNLMEIRLDCRNVDAKNLIQNMKKGASLYAYSSVKNLNLCSQYGVIYHSLDYLDCEKGNHRYEKSITEPTCTQEGKTVFTCSVCGDNYTQTTPALGHSYTQTRTEPTCNKQGEVRKICKTCGDVQVQTLPKLSHESVTVTSKATVNYAGEILTYCKVCGCFISAKSITQIGTIKLSKTTVVYSGKNFRPTISITDIMGRKLTSASYSVQYPQKSAAIGKYAVVITFKGNYTGKLTRYYTVTPKATVVTSLTGGKRSFEIHWKTQSGISGYQFEYSLKPNFAGSKKVTMQNRRMDFYTLRKLQAKKVYYVRIRTYKIVGKTSVFSGWSKTYKVKTK